jgi:hypothetical protein
MIIKFTNGGKVQVKADNLYRSIGGRANPGGVERIDRDGKMEVLPMGGEEVTPKERMAWNAKAKLDPRGRLPEDIYDVTVDEAGNPMAVDDKVRTRLPRKHQFSTEARLSDQRGDKPVFHKSTATSAQAHGETEGMVKNKEHVYPPNGSGQMVNEKDKKMTNKSANYKLADAFRKVAHSIEGCDCLDHQSVAEISSTSDVSVEDVLLLEKIAQNNNNGITDKYKKVKKCPHCQDKSGVPGTVSDPNSQDEDELTKESVKQTAFECGLME